MYTQRNRTELILLGMCCHGNFLILVIIALIYPRDQSTVVGTSQPLKALPLIALAVGITFQGEFGEIPPALYLHDCLVKN